MVLEVVAIVISTVSALTVLGAFYFAYFRGPDIKLKVRGDIKLSPMEGRVPFMIINEGSKPGTFFAIELYPPEVSLPPFLKKFGAEALFLLHENVEILKLGPGDNATGIIDIRYKHKEDMFEKLAELFKQHKEVKIDITYAVTTKKGIEVKTQTFKFETELD